MRHLHMLVIIMLYFYFQFGIFFYATSLEVQDLIIPESVIYYEIPRKPHLNINSIKFVYFFRMFQIITFVSMSTVFAFIHFLKLQPLNIFND